jgi:PAS domain S-box-containing protein
MREIPGFARKIGKEPVGSRDSAAVISDTAASPLTVCARLTHAISRTTRLDDIFAAALAALAAGLGVQRAAILLVGPDGVMRFEAWRGLSDAYRAAVEGHTPWAPGTVGVQPLVVPDVTQDAALAPHLATIQGEHIAAMAFIPLEGVNGVIGKFMLYYPEVTALSDGALELAGLIAAQITLALERTRGLDAARASEERLRFALDVANMGTWDWDLRTQSVRWSVNMERIHGLEPGSFDGSFASYEREIHPDDRAKVYASVQRALSEHVPHVVEYRIVAPDGTVRWVDGKGRLELDAAGHPTRMTGVCMNVTPRKQAELAQLHALGETHRVAQRLAAIVKSSDDAIVSKDLDGIIVSWNPGAERMFGYAAADVIGRSITVIVPEDRRDEEVGVLARIRAGESVEMETVRQRRDGTLLDISLKVSPVRDEAGHITGASKIARDISVRKRDEEERAALARRFALLVDASASLLDSPESASVQTATVSLARRLLVADGYAIWVSEPNQSGWHVAKSEGISEAFANRVMPAQRLQEIVPLITPVAINDVAAQPWLAEQHAAYHDEGIRSMLVCPMRLGADREGTLVFYFRTPHVFSDADIQTGQALANLAAAAMTTAALYDEQQAQRREAESARRRAAFLADATALLSQSLDYQQTLAAVARLAVPEIADWCAVDIVDASGVLQRLAVAHVDPAKVEYARQLEERYPADPAAPGGVHEVIRTGRPAMMVAIPPELVAARARDDEHRRILAELALSSYMCLPIVSAGGAIGAMTFVLAESGRHYTERDLAFAQELLARAALAIDNAFAYRRAYDANRLKDEFLATLSHELRTPLNAILGYAQMLNMGMLQGERQGRAIAVLTRNADALHQIIDDVLDVSRITSGKLRLNIVPISLDEILRNAVATMQPAADAKGVQLHLQIDADLPTISGDPDRLQQVAWNLLSNALKFTPAGGNVRVTLEREGASVQFTVSDDGQGIEAGFLPHIFERFRQADSRFAREHGGLGLGLAIVRDLVEHHGGNVSVTSGGHGQGATFRVRLPIVVAARDDQAATHTRAPLVAPPVGGVGGRLQSVRVLAVDDDPDALGLLRAILETAGAEVTTALSGFHAIELLERVAYDVVIADIGMPKMDGLEFIRRVRQLPNASAKAVPAAALTAYARSEDRTDALRSGYQLHLSKPVNPTELIVAVIGLLNTNQTA